MCKLTISPTKINKFGIKIAKDGIVRTANQILGQKGVSISKLREIYGDDRQRMAQEMQSLYKKEELKPLSGCLPVLIQIPVFFALYNVLLVTIEMRHAPFFGWIRDLSAPDPISIFNGFGLINWEPPQFLMIGLFHLLFGFTFFRLFSDLLMNT